MLSLALSLLIALPAALDVPLVRDVRPALDPERLGIWFGYSVAALGDVNGDGVSDFAVGSPLEHFHRRPGYGPGRVFAVSGATAAVLWRVEGPPWFGEALVELDDFDRDGSPELAVVGGGSRVTVLSGKTGGTIRVHDLRHPVGHQVGTTAASLPDVDGDGIGELIVSCPSRHGIRVYSGSKGRQLLRLQGDRYGSAWGPVLGLEDVDGDGAGDLAFTRRASQGEGEELPPVEVVVVSGRTGEQLYSLDLARPSAQWQVTLCTVGDLDADGIEDFAVAAAQDSSTGDYDDLYEPGIVQLHSGRTGELLRSFAGPDEGVSFGYSIAGSLPGAEVTLLIARHDVGFGGSPSGPSGYSTYWNGRVFELETGAGELRLRCEDKGGFARRVVWLGDVNGDEVVDYLVGASPDNPGDWRQGFVGVYSGATDERLYRVPPEWVSTVPVPPISRAPRND